jgi:HK97 family phage major capsid protein
MQDNRRLREERGEALREAKKLSDKGNLTSAEERKFNALIAEAASKKEQYEEIENRGLGVIRGGQIDGGTTRETSKEKEHRQAFTSYLLMGPNMMPQDQRSLLEKEYRDMGSGGQGAYPGATSGFFVPVGFINQIIEAMKYYGPFFDHGVCELMETETGAPLPLPSDNDTNVIGERIGEGQQVTTADVGLGQIMFGSFKYSSKMVKVSLELLQDSAFDFESYLAKKFAQRLGRILVSDFTSGLGSASSQPMGIITSTVNNGTLITAIGSSPNDGIGAANGLGSDDFINLEHSVDPLYRPGGSFMAHDSTWKAVRKIKDKYGRPLWQPSLVAGEPGTIGGYKMLVNNSMDTLQVTPSSPVVTRNVLLFGDLRNYIIRRVKEMTVLRLAERYADFGQVGFLAFARYDAQPAFGGTGQQFPFAICQTVY